MKVRYLKHGEDLDMNPSIATIGFFDGVHLGHQFLLNKLADMAQQSDLEATVITFDRHLVKFFKAIISLKCFLRLMKS